LNPEAELNC